MAVVASQDPIMRPPGTPKTCGAFGAIFRVRVDGPTERKGTAIAQR